MEKKEVGDYIIKNIESLSKECAAREHAIYERQFMRYDLPLPKFTEHMTNDLSYFGESLTTGRSEVYVSYLNWFRSMSAAQGVPSETILGHLSVVRETLLAKTPSAMHDVINNEIDNAYMKVQEDLTPVASYIKNDVELAPLAKKYLDTLLIGDRGEAREIILAALDEGVSIKDIYMDVFQTAQYEVGRLWQQGEITVAEEHMASAITQAIMAQLYPRIFSKTHNGKKLVAACVSGELHEFGIRMVADFFELDGWETYYLGANMPVKGIIKKVNDVQANVLALSAALVSQARKVRDIVEAVKNDVSHDVKIIVGGHAFNMVPDLWSVVGADGFANTAGAAIEKVNTLIG